MSKLQTKSALRLAILVLVAALTGILTAKPIALVVARHLAVHDGPWETFVDTGGRHADPYTRAAVALAGLYALSSREAVYYTAFSDSAGRPLRGNCDYQVTGTPPAADWWSITLYGADNYLVPNIVHRYSWNAGDLALSADGRFIIKVSSSAQPGQWLPAPGHGRFSLTLRLYHPAIAVRDHLSTVVLPRIERESCR